MSRGLMPLVLCLFLAACAEEGGFTVGVDDPVPGVDPVENPETGLECAGDRAECMQEDIEGE
ncbi:MAG: hypothetical protein AAF495_00030 [Pseudomonadota bacterium]